MKNNNILVAVLDQDGAVHLETIPNTLEALQDLVEGYIEIVPSAVMDCDGGLVDIVNEEGQLLGLGTNKRLPEYMGTVVIAGTVGDELRGLTDCELFEIGMELGRRAR